MKKIANILVVIGVLGLVGGLLGRFVGNPQIIMGFRTMNVILLANSALLLAILLKLSEKK